MLFAQIAKHFIAFYVFTYEYMPFRMGRPKTTGPSHNKKVSTYTGKQPLSKTKLKQLALSAFLNKSKQQNNEKATTSTIVSVCQNYGSGEYWRTKSVKLYEHPRRAFETHAKSKQHKLAEEQKQLSK